MNTQLNCTHEYIKNDKELWCSKCGKNNVHLIDIINELECDKYMEITYTGYSLICIIKYPRYCLRTYILQNIQGTKEISLNQDVLIIKQILVSLIDLIKYYIDNNHFVLEMLDNLKKELADQEIMKLKQFNVAHTILFCNAIYRNYNDKLDNYKVIEDIK